MAQITRCDRCGTLGGDTERAIIRGVSVDVCAECAAAVFDPWVAEVVAAAEAVPLVSARESRRGMRRPPEHGRTAAAIEAAQAAPLALTE